MKKTVRIFTALLAIILITATFAPIAMAQGSDNNPQSTSTSDDNKKDDKDAKKDEAKTAREQKKADFEENKLLKEQIKTATKDQLQAQKELVMQYKAELRTMLQTMAHMTPEEKLANKGEIDALKTQIKEAQKYALQIKTAERAQIRELLPNVTVDDEPSDEDVADASLIVDEL